MNTTQRFQWDEEKAEANYRKHGVDFETATEVFADQFAVGRLDPLSANYRQDRFLITGMVGRPACDGSLHRPKR